MLNSAASLERGKGVKGVRCSTLVRHGARIDRALDPQLRRHSAWKDRALDAQLWCASREREKKRKQERERERNT